MSHRPATGAYPSALDYRDGVAAAAAVATVASFTPPARVAKTYLGGVLDQNKEPDCVLFSVVKLMKLYFFVTTGKWVDLSPRFLAILVKRFDGQDRASGGTYPRLALKLAMQYGCCTTSLLKNDTTLPVLDYRDDSLITNAMFAEASEYCIPGYIQIPVDFVATRQALALYGAVSTLFEIGNELWTPSWNKRDIDPMRPPKMIESGHQMTQNGYSTALNNVENQWSEDWAADGANEFDFKKWGPFIMEQWVIAKIPEDVVDFLKVLPSPASFHYRWDGHLAAGMAPTQDSRALHVALMILGFLPPVAPDAFGYYGPKTTAALARFQAANGISPASGLFGPLTRTALNKRFSV